MVVQRIVAFKYAPAVTAETIAGIADSFLKLKTECKKPSGENYINKVVGGKVTDYGGFEKGLQQAFIIEFQSQEDYDYYLTKDLAHIDFAKYVKEQAVDLILLEFTENKF